MELQGAIIRLQEATIKGNIDSLLRLLSEYPEILDYERCYFNRSALNVALKLGHLDFVNVILAGQPELAEVLSIDDSPSSFTSALHICSEKGYIEMVQLLLNNSSASDMCLAQDSNGRNPVHLAAIRGHQEVLRVLIEAMPMAARELTSQSHGGENILQLCVKYRQLETLTFLIDEMKIRDLLSYTDIHGNTLLHLAVSSEQSQMVEYLIWKRGMEISARNKNGSTAMDICIKNSKDKKHNDIKTTLDRFYRWFPIIEVSSDKLSWVENNRSALLMVASLIATMAFQLGVNPPGGVWQDNKNGHVAGESVLAYQKQDVYQQYSLANVIAFLLSSVTVLLLLSSEYLQPKHVVLFLRTLMFNAVIATAVSYFYSLYALSPLTFSLVMSVMSCLPLGWFWTMILSNGICFCAELIIIILLEFVTSRKERRSTSSSDSLTPWVDP